MAAVEIRDPTIKLFGKTIALPLNHVDLDLDLDLDLPNEDSDCKFVSSDTTVPKDGEKENSCDELASEKQGNGSTKEITDQTTSGVSENPSIEREISSPKASKNEEQGETSISPDKTPKKPDKIIPCPRCNSMDTKFCYYNNYNVNQPRHFCKNCQRYWTAGGTMRNVPVGAGRRKNKSTSSSHFRQLIIPDGGIHHHQFLGNNGTFLTFGSDSSVSDSKNCNPNGFLIGTENGDDHSSKSSITASNSSEKGSKNPSQQSVVKNVLPLPFPPQLQPFTGLPWPYSSMAPPLFCPPGFPVSYYPPPPYWGCTAPPPWTVINHNGQQNPFTNSSVLGKRLREGKTVKSSGISQPEEVIKQSNNCEEPCVWIPKTLKMDDSNEAAKSSIWSTLGIKNEKAAASSINGSGLFASFQQATKGKEENETESWSLLQANPAAFSRALKFREIA